MKKYLVFFISTMLPSFLFAGTIRCPIPFQHMKEEFFTISKHEAKMLLRNKDTGFLWSILIHSDIMIIDKEVIARFLRANKLQQYAYESSGLGQYKYSCTYINPLPYKAIFIAGSNGY